MTTIKEPIRLRAKTMKNGGKSLYLDCFHNGRRTYEFLKLYLIPERTRWDKERNKTTMMQAESHKAKRIIELQQGRYGIVQSGFANRIKLSEYIARLGNERAKKGATSSYYHYKRTSELIKRYGDIDLQSIDKQYIKGFISFVGGLQRYELADKTTINESTLQCRCRVLNCALNRAVKDSLLLSNPYYKLTEEERPKARPKQREYLTMQEVEALSNTICQRGTIKRMFLFSCFCGLRYSDIIALRWQDIKPTSEGGLQIEIKQKKTKRIVYVPLSANAQKWLPQRTDETKESDKVFTNRILYEAKEFSKWLNRWASDAGITKHITFHVARHTCATLLLTYGADIYTVSKILGHSSVKTTEIYAKVIDKKRTEAVNLIPTI